MTHIPIALYVLGVFAALYALALTLEAKSGVPRAWRRNSRAESWSANVFERPTRRWRTRLIFGSSRAVAATDSTGVSRTILGSSTIRDPSAHTLHARGMQEQVADSFREIRRRRDPQHAMRLLLEELTHRVGREFAAAIRIASGAVALAQPEEMRSAINALQIRLENFARVHEALRIPEFRGSTDACAYLGQLCGAISGSRLQSQGIRLELLKRKVQLDSEQCWRLGMIVSALIRNAATHSFANSPPRIAVTASRRGPFICCRVEDNGVASEDDTNSRDTRIAVALARELHGEIEQYHGGDGCVATVMFPAACTSGFEG